MMANLKKSFKLLRYSHNFKGMMGVMALLFAASIFVDILAFEFGYDVQMMGNILLFLALTVPMQLKEDLMLSQMLVSSGLRRFFDVNFADILLLLGSLASYLIKIIFVVLLCEEGKVMGSNITALFLTIGCVIGIITVSFGFMMKSMLFSFFIYFIIGIPCVVLMACIEKLIEKDMLNPGKLQAFVIGTCFVLVGNLLAMYFRRKLYRKPLSRFAGSEDLKKAMV